VLIAAAVPIPRIWPLLLVGILAPACTAQIADGPGDDDDDDSSAADGGAVVDAPPPIPPGDAGAGDVHFTIDSSAEVHPISRYIYGQNGVDWNGRGAHLTLTRMGGNRLTAYNWENNASNAGSDWYHQNDSLLGGGDVPGEATRVVVAEAHDHGGSAIVTVPLVGHVAADKNGDGDVAATPNYLDVRFHRSVARKGAPFADPPDQGDQTVYQDEYVAWLESHFPEARSDPNRTIFYDLDNEPDLWSSTHARIHPEPVGYQELIDLNIEYAAAIKDVVPGALVFGFVSYGWNGYVNLQNAPDSASRDFIDTYLAAIAAASASAGHRLIDVLDLHWYPEAQGDGTRIVAADASPGVAAARMQAPRSLWDPGYTETSWITEFSTLGPIALLPRLRDKIAAGYPGTRLAFSEYYYGGGNHISGGIAQADVLGIFGREEVFAATLWSLVGADQDAFIAGAFELFRSYDGEGGAFGDTSIAATTDDHATTSVYASHDAGDYDRLVVVAINKSDRPVRAAITISHGVLLGSAEVYQLSAASSSPVRADDVAIAAANAFVYEMPATSASVLVLK
jgi:hypothetical protein